MNTMKNWNRIVWAVGVGGTLMVSCPFDYTSDYPGFKQVMLFPTREAARRQCKSKKKDWRKRFGECARNTYFRPVKVRETLVPVIP